MTRGFTISAAAKYLGISVSTMRRWTDDGDVLCYRTPGNQRRYRREELDAFIKEMQADVNRTPEEQGADMLNLSTKEFEFLIAGCESEVWIWQRMEEHELREDKDDEAERSKMVWEHYQDRMRLYKELMAREEQKQTDFEQRMRANEELDNQEDTNAHP